ncbi:hypothetical protein ACQY0O_001952 [Thecaphora frezii]
MPPDMPILSSSSQGESDEETSVVGPEWPTLAQALTDRCEGQRLPNLADDEEAEGEPEVSFDETRSWSSSPSKNEATGLASPLQPPLSMDSIQDWNDAALDDFDFYL